jgi:hypothetical protein
MFETRELFMALSPTPILSCLNISKNSDPKGCLQQATIHWVAMNKEMLNPKP